MPHTHTHLYCTHFCNFHAHSSPRCISLTTPQHSRTTHCTLPTHAHPFGSGLLVRAGLPHTSLALDVYPWSSAVPTAFPTCRATTRHTAVLRAPACRARACARFPHTPPDGGSSPLLLLGFGITSVNLRHTHTLPRIHAGTAWLRAPPDACCGVCAARASGCGTFALCYRA